MAKKSLPGGLRMPHMRLKTSTAIFRKLRVKMGWPSNRKKQGTKPSPEPLPDILPFIDTLPEEILSYIFLVFSNDLQPGWVGQGTRHETITLMLVCKRWRSTALAIKQLWTAIDLSCSRVVPLLLERSGDASIDVFFTASPIFHRLNIEDTCRAWNLILSGSRRISSLRLIYSQIGNQHIISELIPLLCDPKLTWPSLNELELCLHSKRQGLVPVTLDFHGPVLLTRIRLDKICIPFTSTVFGPRLQDLHLAFMSIHLTDLLSLLKRCTQLKELGLNNLTLTGSAHDREQLSEAPMNRFKCLYIDNLSLQDTHLFLEHPNLSNEVFTHLIMKNFDDLLPLSNRTLARFHQNTILYLMFNERKFGGATIEGFGRPGEKTRYYSAASDTRRDTICIETGVYSPAAISLLKTFSSSNCRLLSISFPQNETPVITAEQWQNVLIHFPQLKFFNLRDISPSNMSQVVAPIQALGLSCGSQERVAPSLHVIILRVSGSAVLFDREWEEVVTALKRRAEQAKKLAKLRVVCGPSSNPSDTEPLERRKKLMESLAPYVVKITLSRRSEYAATNWREV